AAVIPAPAARAGAAPSAGLLERELPWLPERVAAIALCGLRSLTRAPEAKMMLLSPVILLVVFGSMAWKRSIDSPEMARPLLATLPEFVCMYLPFCVLGNFLSIFAPMPIRAGSFKPMNPKVIPVLLHLAAALLSPLVLVPALVPLGVEFVVEELAGNDWVP